MTSARTVAILGTRYPSFAVEEQILSPIGVTLREGSGDDAAGIIAEVGDAQVVLAGSRPKFTTEVITALAAAGTRGIVRYGVGTDSIDLDAARAAGLWVARVSDYGTEAVATHAVAMAMAAMRRLREADLRIRNQEWGFAPLRPLHLPSHLTAGVVGAGRIGQHAARQFVGLGFRVLAHDIAPNAHVEGAEMVSFEDLITRSDIVSLHAPGQPGADALMNAAVLAQMKPGSVLVNTARGSLIDAAALARGLAAGRPGFAALDVFATEPPDLTVFDGVEDSLLLSPHMAWYSEESEEDMRIKAAESARDILEGESPRDVVVDPTATRR